jgi:hypothetical protein
VVNFLHRLNWIASVVPVAAVQAVGVPEDVLDTAIVTATVVPAVVVMVTAVDTAVDEIVVVMVTAIMALTVAAMVIVAVVVVAALDKGDPWVLAALLLAHLVVRVLALEEMVALDSVQIGAGRGPLTNSERSGNRYSCQISLAHFHLTS